VVFGVPMIEAYGMSEAPHITCNPFPGHRRGSVGPSVAPEIRVLDLEGQPRPPGEEGEIAVRGPTVTSGYLGDPVATAESFVKGWLRTGDLGWLDADGFLHLTGRRKR
jgi:long-subunit acyl-CoA synthetase (AMP-forming)